MLTKRIIPCLDVTQGRVVKGTSFTDLRDAGDPVELAAFYYREDADELVKQIVGRYKDKVTKDGGPWGHTFPEIYDLKTLTPREKFLRVYDKVWGELGDMGIEY